MTSPTRLSGLRRLVGVRYGYAFFDDLVLLYPVYALLFADTGLSTWQISSLFIIWAASGIVLEIPSGAWADLVSRRWLLCAGPLLTAAGFLVWVLVPSYPAFAVGFLLWGIKGALGSGALEALLYEELDRLGAASRYARIQGRAEAVGMLGVVVATAAAAPVFVHGGYLAVGLASVAACLLTALVAAGFPEHRRSARSPARSAALADSVPGSAGAPPGYLATLRGGLAEAWRNPRLRRALVMLPAVVGVWGALEEYAPLLVREAGVATARAPLVMLVIWAGTTAGGLAAGAAGRLGGTGLAVLLLAGAAALAVGAVSRHVAGMVLVAAAFGAFQAASIVADARLQERITGPARATITSVGGLATDITTIGVFGLYAVISPAGHGVAFAVLAIPYVLVAAALARPRPGTVGAPVAGEPVSGHPAAGDPLAGDPLAGEPATGDRLAGVVVRTPAGSP